MLQVGYDFTPKKAAAAVASYYDIPVEDVVLLAHKHGGYMFFPNSHLQPELYKKVV